MRNCLIAMLCLTVVGFADVVKGDQTVASTDSVYESIPREHFLDLLRNLEKSVTGYRYAFEADGSHDGSKIEPSLYEGTLTYDLVNRRYKLEASSISEWQQGAAPYAASRFGMSFDGKVYSSWDHELHGRKLPPVIADPEHGILGMTVEEMYRESNIFPPSGEIGNKDKLGRPFETYKSTCGLRSMPPNLILGLMNLECRLEHKKSKSLSECLEQFAPAGFRTTKIDERIYRVVLTRPSIPNGELTLEVDAGFHGMLRSMVWDIKTPNRTLNLYRYMVHFSDAGNYPSAIMSDRDGSRFNIRFHDFKVNPELNDADFELRFPPGTGVDDHIQKKYFVAGDQKTSEEQKSKNYAQRHSQEQ